MCAVNNTTLKLVNGCSKFNYLVLTRQLKEIGEGQAERFPVQLNIRKCKYIFCKIGAVNNTI